MKSITKSSVFILSILFSGLFYPTPAAADCSLTMERFNVWKALLSIPKLINIEAEGPTFELKWRQDGSCYDVKLLHEKEFAHNPSPVTTQPEPLGRRLLLAPSYNYREWHEFLNEPPIRYWDQYELECFVPSHQEGNTEAHVRHEYQEMFGDVNDQWDDQYGLAYSDHDYVNDGRPFGARNTLLPLSEWGKEYQAGQVRPWTIQDVAPLRICGYREDVYLHDVPFLSFAAGIARQGVPSYAEAFVSHEDEEGNNLGTLDSIRWASFTGKDAAGREILSSAPLDAQGNELPCDPAVPGFMQEHRVGGCNGESMGADGIVDVLQRRLTENGGCPQGTTCKIKAIYYFNHVKSETGHTPEYILPNWLGRVNQIHTFTLASAGGVIRTARVRTCSIFEEDPLQACDEPGKIELSEPVYTWGPLWDIDFPIPYEMSDEKVIIDPDYKKDRQDNAKYTPSPNSVSPLDKVRFTLKSYSFRARELYHTKVKLMMKNEQGVEAEIHLDDNSPYPLRLVWKDGQHMSPTQEMTPEVDAWFKNHGDGPYTFETPTIDLKADWRLIYAAAEDLPVFFRVYRESYVAERATTTAQGTQIVERVTVPEKKFQDIPLKLTNCAQIYGTGKHKIVWRMGRNYDIRERNDKDFRQAELLRITENFTDFENVQPLIEFRNQFSFFADLKEMEEDQAIIYGLNAEMDNIDLGNNDIYSMWDIRDNSSCKDADVTLMATDITGTAPNSRWLGIASPLTATAIVNREDPDGSIALHEFGHAFAGLADEYFTRGPVEQRFFGVFIPAWNCARGHEVRDFFIYNGMNYADGEWVGCMNAEWFHDVEDGNEIFEFLYRPSDRSIMSNAARHRMMFNVPSCASFIHNIYGMNTAELNEASRSNPNSIFTFTSDPNDDIDQRIYYPLCAQLLNVTPRPAQ